MRECSSKVEQSIPTILIPRKKKYFKVKNYLRIGYDSIINHQEGFISVGKEITYIRVNVFPSID